MAPIPLLANTGTPMMWAGALHLLVGNAVIGLGEGLLIARLFRVPRRGAVIAMVIANYASFFPGLAAMDGFRVFVETHVFTGPPIREAIKIHILTGVTAYLATILLEWPFCWFILRKQAGRVRRSLLASLAAQSASYAVLALLYTQVSTMTLLTDSDLRARIDFAAVPQAWVYFIDPADGAVDRIRLDGSGREPVLDTSIQYSGARLFVRPDDSSKSCELWSVMGERGTPPKRLIAIKVKLARPLAQAGSGSEFEPETWMTYHYYPSQNEGWDLRPSQAQEWTALGRFWAAEGIVVMCGKQRVHRLAYESPLSGGPFAWTVRNVVLLPGDQALFQVKDQLLLLDLKSKKLGFLCMGRGPVVVLPQ